MSERADIGFYDEDGDRISRSVIDWSDAGLNYAAMDFPEGAAFIAIMPPSGNIIFLPLPKVLR